MATVITNLMSAIPWLGQDIVEFLWGGLSLLIEEPNNNNIVKQILLNAGIFPIIVFGYVCAYIAVKKPKAREQSAGVRDVSTLEASQRLNAENFTYAYLVDLFEGDGIFTVTKKENIFNVK